MRLKQWRVWVLHLGDEEGQEKVAKLGAEPFAVENGRIYWKAQEEVDDDTTTQTMWPVRKGIH